MDFPLARKKNALPGRTVRVRAHRNLATLLGRVREGDLVVIDQLDLDGETARALLERKPFAVLNAAPFISGRYPNLGPKVLADGGVLLLRGRRDQVLALRDGSEVRLHEETLYDPVVVLLDVEQLTGAQVGQQMAQAQSGLAVQLESFAHSASEFLHREEPLLLHGDGLPALRTKVSGRVVVVVGPGARKDDLKKLRRFLRASQPVLIGVDGGLEALAARGLKPDIGVLSGGSTVTDKVLRRCREIVLTEPGRIITGQVEKVNRPVTSVESSAAPVDLALLLARHGGARLIVPVGTPSTLEELIDRDRNDQASNVLTRLRLGALGVEGAVVPTVLGLRRRRRAPYVGAVVLAAVLAGLVLTPTGRGWRDDLRDRLPEQWSSSSALDREKAAVAARDQQIASLKAQGGRSDAYVEATAHGAVRGTLVGRAVALVVLPGADPDAVAALRSLIATAGAQVTAEATVLPAAAAGTSLGLVDALTSQMLARTPDVRVPAGADGSQRLGALLARTVAVPSTAHLMHAPYDARAVGVASGLKAAGLLSTSITARAALTLVVTGDGAAAASTAPTWATITDAYARAVPTVVLGPDAEVIRALGPGAGVAYSTVDGAGTTTGRVAAVLALAARTHGRVGSYGTSGADGTVPPS